MKVAVFSDVHANLPALETFVEATREEVDSYLCLGDVVDYGPWNDECIDLVRSLPGIVLLEGNHERMFRGDEAIDDKPELAQLFFHASHRSFTRQSALEGLPESTTVGEFRAEHTIAGLRLYSNTPIEVTGKHFVGHSHYQFRRDFPGGGVLVNCGSVGQNRRRIDRASYVVYDVSTGEIRLEERTYPLDRFLAEVESRHYPEPCIRYYRRKLAEIPAA
jgi:predicted phosphodiesterase